VKTIFKDKTLYEVLFLLGGLVSIAWSLYFCIAIILTPYQIELREGASQVITDFLLRGENPYTLANQPLTTNGYGILYNLFVLPFAAVFGNTLVVHRSVTFIFIILIGVYCYSLVYDRTKSMATSLMCSAFVFVAAIADGGIGAFSRSTGLFFFIVAIFLPNQRSFDVWGLIWGLLSTLIAFYAKPYFLIPLGIISAYIFFFISKKKGLQFIFSFMGLLLATILIVRQILPLYFANIIFGTYSDNLSTSGVFLVVQLLFLAFFFFPILGFILFRAALIYRDRSKNKALLTTADRSPFDVKNWDAPLFNFKPDYYLFGVIFTFLVFIFILGVHVGAFLNYAYQLVLPLFFLWFFRIPNIGGRLKILFIFTTLLNMVFWLNWVQNPSMLSQSNKDDLKRLNQYLDNSKVTLNSPSVVSQILEHHQTVYDSGLTYVYYKIKPFPDNYLSAATYSRLYQDGQDYKNLIQNMIKLKKFDLVLTTKNEPSFYDESILPDYYAQMDELKINMPQTGQDWVLVVWKPRLK
jgi:hypothetical protein